MEKFKINKFIFSYFAKVYGDQNLCPLKENKTLQSVNPYNIKKIIIEQLII